MCPFLKQQPGRRSLEQGRTSHLCYSSHMHQAGHSTIRPSHSPCSPGLSSVIGMKGNGPERRGKETFLHTYLLMPARSRTQKHPDVCAHTHTQTHAQTRDLLQKQHWFNRKTSKAEHISNEASQRMKGYSNSNSFVSLRECT